MTKQEVDAKIKEYTNLVLHGTPTDTEAEIWFSLEKEIHEFFSDPFVSQVASTEFADSGAAEVLFMMCDDFRWAIEHPEEHKAALEKYEREQRLKRSSVDKGESHV